MIFSFASSYTNGFIHTVPETVIVSPLHPDSKKLNNVNPDGRGLSSEMSP